MSICIAAVACLDEGRSAHTKTFMQAVEMYQTWLSQRADCKVAVQFYDDSASASTARVIAKQIIADNVTAVVGHFASAAADAAAPLYAEAGISLFLPAATASHLTVNRTTFRICDNDNSFAEFIRAFCRSNAYWFDQVMHDGSLHGISVANALAEHVLQTVQRPNVVLFSGSCQQSINFLDQLDWNDMRPVLLTDDAYSHEIFPSASRRPGGVIVMGFSPQSTGRVAQWIGTEYVKLYDRMPSCYFWETVAALEVAVASADGDPAKGTWETVLGPINFDARREANPRTFAAYRVDAGKFEPIRGHR